MPLLQRRATRSLLFTAIALAISGGTCAVSEVGERDEVRVTIGFVLNFARFTQWPDKPGVPSDQFRIGVLGDDQLAEAMEMLAAGRRVKGVAVVVARATSVDDLRSCNVAFFGPDVRRTSAYVQQLTGVPVLTVSTAKGFSSQGGMIELFLRDNRMQFAINREAVANAGLRISPELQQLASPR